MDWKKQTLANIPELKTYTLDLNAIKSPMQLWIELNFMFQKAAESKNEDLIQRIFKEAIWYLENTNNSSNVSRDFITAVVLTFFEDLPSTKGIEKYLPLYLPKKYLIDFKSAFTYFEGEKRYQELLNTY